MSSELRKKFEIEVKKRFVDYLKSATAMVENDDADGLESLGFLFALFEHSEGCDTRCLDTGRLDDVLDSYFETEEPTTIELTVSWYELKRCEGEKAVCHG